MNTEELKAHRLHMKISIHKLAVQMEEFDKSTQMRANKTIINLRRQIKLAEDDLTMQGVRP